MRITIHVGIFTVTIIVKKRKNRHPARRQGCHILLLPYLLGQRDLQALDAACNRTLEKCGLVAEYLLF